MHGAEFKAKVLAQCRVAGASVAAVAQANGLNANLVRKWLEGRGLKRCELDVDGVAGRALVPAQAAGVHLQFVPVERRGSSVVADEGGCGGNLAPAVLVASQPLEHGVRAAVHQHPMALQVVQRARRPHGPKVLGRSGQHQAVRVQLARHHALLRQVAAPDGDVDLVPAQVHQAAAQVNVEHDVRVTLAEGLQRGHQQQPATTGYTSAWR